MIYFLLLGYHPESVVPGTLLLESFYATPATVYASTGLIMMLFRNFSWQLLGFFLISYVVFVVAILLDPWLCRHFGNTYWDLWTTPALFFAATDLVYVGLGLWLENKYIILSAFSGTTTTEALKKHR